ncbi:ethanolamine utilization protein EutQ [Pseudoduganella sp. SL102]|uniref:cupin domain-containing protein n=1 Tax=Pseudoduganella sp. SL102 TaxID=2995154 RepID=UPI00248BC8C9|nr:cupin domain-containing protein [Pseudoduganella sp. SL102]WBS05192.1 ethanolamine utilization protein EutQ [Pseudoduganella sp. SL102]
MSAGVRDGAAGRRPVVLVDHASLDYTRRGGPPDAAWVARAVSNEVSPHIGFGFARWEGAEVAWTVLYDELIFVIEGTLELEANGEPLRITPGQLVWIPEGSELVYGGHALFGYVVRPANWKELHGLA